MYTDLFKAYTKQGTCEKRITNFGKKDTRGRHQLKDLNVDGRKILKLTVSRLRFGCVNTIPVPQKMER
jgi:hypothetical protein